MLLLRIWLQLPLYLDKNNKDTQNWRYINKNCFKRNVYTLPDGGQIGHPRRSLFRTLKPGTMRRQHRGNVDYHLSRGRHGASSSDCVLILTHTNQREAMKSLTRSYTQEEGRKKHGRRHVFVRIQSKGTQRTSRVNCYCLICFIILFSSFSNVRQNG